MAPPGSTQAPPSWRHELTPYHWWILVVCALGWLFDTMDMRIFVLARSVAIKELVGETGDTEAIGRWATTIFIVGWATGGIVFGVLGDKWGRAKTMVLTILLYASFTALSGLARTSGEFMAYSFLNGLGVGGEFSVGVALLAEVIPERPRPYALAIVQGLSAVGNIVASILGYFILPISWRYLFYVGAVPALLAGVILRRVTEPESWRHAQRLAQTGRGLRLGSYSDLLVTNPKWRRHALIGGAIAVVGVTGVWGVGFYSPELIGNALAGLDAKVVAQKTTIMTICQDLGAFASITGFAFLSNRWGRKPAFQLGCWLGLLSITVVFGLLSSPAHIVPFGLLLGFGTLFLFGGYAVYLPELFPTRLRSTGVAFCYNVGRYVAALLNLVPNYIRAPMERAFPAVPAYRATAMAMGLIYFVGMAVMIFAPETRGRTLPTDGEVPT